jgi:hypothetical protein
MERKALVLDANILIRAVLGQRVRRISKPTLRAFRSSSPKQRLRKRRSTWPIWF